MSVFNSVVNVLTERASKTFRFKEQEQLHEEVIDTGLAKIYQSHLEIARTIAKEDHGYNLKITLLDGKAFEKVLQYTRKTQPWMLVLGRIGVHSETDMDIGSNTENLLRLAPCNVLLSSARYVPKIDVKARGDGRLDAGSHGSNGESAATDTGHRAGLPSIATQLNAVIP